MSFFGNISTDTVRKIINRALDDFEAIDIGRYTSAISSGLSFQWVKSEWFEWRSHYVPLAFIMIFFWPVFATLLVTFTAASTWLFWLLTSLVFGMLQLFYVMYQFIMIFSDILILTLFKTYSLLRSQLLHYIGKSGWHGAKRRKSGRRIWKKKLAGAGTYENFLKIAVEEKIVEELTAMKRRPSLTSMLMRSNSFDGSPSRKTPIPRNNKSYDARIGERAAVEAEQQQQDSSLKEELGKTSDILLATTSRLREARLQASNEGTSAAANSLKYLLSGVVKRNHLMLDALSEQNARSVADTGKFGLSQEGRSVIRAYYEEVQKGLDWIADAPLDMDKEGGDAEKSKDYGPMGFLKNGDQAALDEKARQTELHDRCTLVRKMKQNMGRTALMLSGGGAQAMYHLGTIRALIESKLYDDMKVISGTSGGSITAAMCALRKPEELFNHVCVANVSTDFMLNGDMKKNNIRWFPPVTEMGAYWLKHKLLVDSKDFKKCCDFYYGDATFEEAFERTGKHVCITVSASRATGGTAQRLLLNHISTPHVTLASAVAASCALPGVMAPAKLLIKDSTGKQEPFEVDGVEWIDGSVQADLPFERISTLFNVSNYVVCQTNFHVMPFLNKAHHPNARSVYWRLFQAVEWDIRSRALKLSRLGLFPRIFGQDISKVFKQKYHGHLTLVPRFTAMQTFGLQALANPTASDMENYLKYGQVAAWPYLTVISDMMRLERGLDDCLARLHERRRGMSPDWDDVESITSAPSSVLAKGVRFLGSGREAERLKQKIIKLEHENFSLKLQLDKLQHKMSEPEHIDETKENADSVGLTTSASSSSLVLTEREVWSLLQMQKS